MKALLLAAGLLLMPAFAGSGPAPFAVLQTLRGRVVHITDGDSLTLRVADRPELKVRLWGIDCPEWRQAFGRKAADNARRLAAGVEVTVQLQGVDKYQRVLGWVNLPSGECLNELQVRAGLAWWYEHYAPEALGLRDLEREAREGKLGLWGEREPVAPWVWRRGRRG